MNLDKKMWENLPEKPKLKPKCRSIWKKTPKRFRKNSLTFGRKRKCVCGQMHLRFGKVVLGASGEGGVGEDF